MRSILVVPGEREHKKCGCIFYRVSFVIVSKAHQHSQTWVYFRVRLLLGVTNTGWKWQSLVTGSTLYATFCVPDGPAVVPVSYTAPPPAPVTSTKPPASEPHPPSPAPQEPAKPPPSPATPAAAAATAKSGEEPAVPDKVTYLIVGAGTAAFAAYRSIRGRDPKAQVRIALNLKSTKFFKPMGCVLGALQDFCYWETEKKFEFRQCLCVTQVEKQRLLVWRAKPHWCKCTSLTKLFIAGAADQRGGLQPVHEAAFVQRAVVQRRPGSRPRPQVQAVERQREEV